MTLPLGNFAPKPQYLKRCPVNPDAQQLWYPTPSTPDAQHTPTAQPPKRGAQQMQQSPNSTPRHRPRSVIGGHAHTVFTTHTHRCAHASAPSPPMLLHQLQRHPGRLLPSKGALHIWGQAPAGLCALRGYPIAHVDPLLTQLPECDLHTVAYMKRVSALLAGGV